MMKPLWKCDAHRIAPRAERDQLSVFVDVTVNPADQVRIRTAIEREVREQVAQDIEGRVSADHPNQGYRDGIAYAAHIARGES